MQQLTTVYRKYIQMTNLSNPHFLKCGRLLSQPPLRIDAPVLRYRHMLSKKHIFYISFLCDEVDPWQFPNNFLTLENYNGPWLQAG